MQTGGALLWKEFAPYMEIRGLTRESIRRRRLRLIEAQESRSHASGDTDGGRLSVGYFYPQRRIAMLANKSNYDFRGAANHGIVFCCPRIVAKERLVYF